MVKAVIFDIGGVLAHDVWEHLLLDEDNGVAAKYALNRDEVKRVGRLLWEAFAYLPETPQANHQIREWHYWELFTKEFAEHLPSNASPDTFIRTFISMTDAFIQPIPDMIPVLERLQAKGIGLAICSNNNEFWFRRQMDKLSLLHRFFSPNKVILSCRVGVGKSSPRFEMFHAVVDALGVGYTECVFVDDRPENIQRAQQCGMAGIDFTDAVALDAVLAAMGV